MVLGWCGDPFSPPLLSVLSAFAVFHPRGPHSVQYASTECCVEWPLWWALMFLLQLWLCTHSALVFITTHRNTKEQRHVEMKSRSVNLLWLHKTPRMLLGVWTCSSLKLSCTVASLLRSFPLECQKSVKSWNQE